MRPAVIVVDMVKDNLRSEYPISKEVRSILPTVQRLLATARARNYPIVFACDSFLPDDFIFRGKLKPHSIQGTQGAEVMDELALQPTDLVLPKRRFSAFFKTGLEETLHGWGVDMLVVAGVATHFCVLTTAMDGICHDFQVTVLEDCCASYNAKIHACAVKMYKRNAVEPLLQFLTLNEFLALVEANSPQGERPFRGRVDEQQ
jgi:nicotinamidase-related amidase